MTAPNFKNLQEIANRTAKMAGEILLSAPANYRHINDQTDTDVKLQADVESEKKIREVLETETDYPVYGEELAGDLAHLDADNYTWVVDPLDGTYNYLRNAPLCGVSIGLCKGREPILGSIYNFYADELYCGNPEEGFLFNGEKITPKWEKEKSKAVIATGFPSGRDYSSKSLTDFISRVQTYKKTRMIGSAALAMAYVAMGRVDLYFEESIRLWDIAAGAALIKAAGGAVSMVSSDDHPLGYNVWGGPDASWFTT